MFDQISVALWPSQVDTKLTTTDSLDKLWSIQPVEFCLAVNEKGPPDAGSNLGNPKGIMLSEKINLRRPHTVWFHLHNLLKMRHVGKETRLVVARAEGWLVGVVGCDCGGWHGELRGGDSYIFPLCSGCMNLHTWQQGPGSHRHCTLASVPSFQDGVVFVSGVTRKEDWVKGAWGLFVLSLQLTLISLLSSKYRLKKNQNILAYLFF